MQHFPGSSANRIGEQNLTARRERNRFNLARERALVGNRERLNQLDFVAEEVDAHRVLCGRRKYVENAAAHRELTAPRDHVDSAVREGNQTAGEFARIEAAVTATELEQRLGADV